jgi:hypothetical protein
MADADALGDDHTTFIELEGMATLRPRGWRLSGYA